MLGILILALLYSIAIAKPVLLPIVLALLLNFVLRPVHRILRRMYIPKVIGAVVILMALAGMTLWGLTRLAGPASEWFQELPASLYRIQDELADLLEPVQRVSQVADRVDEFAQMNDESEPPKLQVETPAVSDKALDYLQDFGGYLVLTFILLFFMLTYGERFYKRLAHDPGTADAIDEIADNVSNYLLTVTVINICLGLAVGIAMFLLGLTNPVLWGVMATVLNFVPVLGALVGVGIMSFVSLLLFDSFGQVILPPLLYFILTNIEGNFVTPMVLGKRFTINPIIIFVWLLFWGWMWGIPGALLAVPLLMAFRIFCEHFRPFNGVGELLGR